MEYIVDHGTRLFTSLIVPDIYIYISSKIISNNLSLFGNEKPSSDIIIKSNTRNELSNRIHEIKEIPFKYWKNSGSSVL